MSNKELMMKLNRNKINFINTSGNYAMDKANKVAYLKRLTDERTQIISDLNKTSEGKKLLESEGY